jgi:DinB superfamily
MEIRQTLIEISNDARAWLNAWTKDFTDAERNRASNDRTSPNPLAWQLGHIASVEDDVVQLFSGGPAIVSVPLRAICGTGSPIPTITTKFPSLAELRTLLERTHLALITLVENADEADLDRPPLVENRFFRTLGQSVYEAALHENYHVGQIASLRKAIGKARLA